MFERYIDGAPRWLIKFDDLFSLFDTVTSVTDT